MWHARGYGGFGKSEAVVVPGFSHALVTDCVAWLSIPRPPGRYSLWVP